MPELVIESGHEGGRDEVSEDPFRFGDHTR